MLYCHMDISSPDCKMKHWVRRKQMSKLTAASVCSEADQQRNRTLERVLSVVYDRCEGCPPSEPEEVCPLEREQP